jgi:Mitochondrial carrier protein
MTSAVVRIYSEGGIRGFWIGNGLSVAKIFPESAIKFMSYETAVSFLHLLDILSLKTLRASVETTLRKICG